MSKADNKNNKQDNLLEGVFGILYEILADPALGHAGVSEKVEKDKTPEITKGETLADVLRKFKEETGINPSVSPKNLDNGPLLAEHKLRILHCNNGKGNRSFTHAFKKHRKGIYEVVTSICHPNDDFCKKIGTRQAIGLWEFGHVTYIPADSDDQLIMKLKAVYLDSWSDSTFGY